MDFIDRQPNGGLDLDDDQWFDGQFRAVADIAFPTNFPVTKIAFDPVEELVWMGNANGRLYSMLSPNGERYTACAGGLQATPINDIMATEGLVLALSSKNLKGVTRQGVSQMNHSSSNMEDMTSFLRCDSGALLMGGNQNKMIQFDMITQQELRVATMKEQQAATQLRANGRHIFAADQDGNIGVRDPLSLDFVRSINCSYSGPIQDFDVCGTNVITCGYSMRNGSLHSDQYFKVFDLRTYQMVSAFPWQNGPYFCRFMPNYSNSRIVLVSSGGDVQILDLNNINSPEPMFHVNPGGGCNIVGFDFSTTKHFLAFGTDYGTVHLYADQQDATFNVDSFPTEFADALLGPPQSFPITDETTPLASVPLPFSTDDTYLSDWPEDLCIPTYRTPKPLTQHQSVRTSQFVGYAPNPRKHLGLKNYNIIPYILEVDEKTGNVSRTSPVHHNVQDHLAAPLIPTFYRKLAINCKNQLIKEELLKNLNPARLTTQLENNSGSGFANPLLSVLHWVIPFRNIFLSHICTTEPCLCCELGFLFRILTDQKNAEVAMASSNNFLRSLRACDFTAPQKEHSNTLVSKLFTYLIDYVHKRLPAPEKSVLGGLLETEVMIKSSCIACRNVTSSEFRTMSITLNYTSGADLCKVIEKSLVGVGYNEQACVNCRLVTRHEYSKKIQKLPPVLLINTNPSAEGYHNFWSDQIKMKERRPNYVQPDLECFADDLKGAKSEKQCRWGSECKRRAQCGFTHPTSGQQWAAECTKWLESDQSTFGSSPAAWSHCIPSRLYSNSTGCVYLRETPSDSIHDNEYTLTAMVVGVADKEGQWTHAVAEVSDPSATSEPSWCVLNDLSAVRVPKDEALHMDERWKQPYVLAYVRQDCALTVEGPRALVPDTVFSTDANLTGNAEIARQRRDRKLPGRGSVVALDAEFIQIQNESGHIARLSCVDGIDGQIIIDDYVLTKHEEENNYLTNISGIIRADLDPGSSTKHLTTLKTVYLKVLHLAQNGVIFVGHGLDNDFAALNLHVPSCQIQDTVKLFRMKDLRMVALRYLAYYLLKETFQDGHHDSVEDSLMALKVYNKYKELEKEGKIAETLVHMYETGKHCNFRTGLPCLGDVPSPVRGRKVGGEAKEANVAPASPTHN